MKNTYNEDMARLAPITEEAWREYHARNLEKLAESEKVTQEVVK
jgi:hypothetical protein